MYVDLHLKQAVFLSTLMKLDFSGQIFEKYAKIKHNENLFSGSLVIARGQAERHGEATSHVLQFANAPKRSECRIITLYKI